MDRLSKPLATRAPMLVVLLAALLVACAQPPPPPAVAPAPQPAPPPSAVAPRAQLRAGTSGEYPPLSIWKGDRITGFGPALVSAFASAGDMEVTWARFTWPGLAEDFRAGRFDLAADGITVRPERSIAGRFTVPFARGGAILLLRRPSWAPPAVAGGPPLAGIDKPSLRVVVNLGGHLERVARSLLHAADIRAIADNDGVRAAFARGEADAAMTNTFEAAGWASGMTGIEQLGPLTQDVTAVWVRADQSELAERLDAWLIDQEENGKLGALRGTWLGAGAGPPAALPVSAIFAATAERLALMPLVAAAKATSGKAVEDAAQEERVIAASTNAVAKAAAFRNVAPPARAVVEAFFREQIEAAKSLQQRPIAAPSSAAPSATAPSPAPAAPSYSLEKDLRPAIARISARLAYLLVRLPRSADRAAIAAEARADLASTGLDAAHIDRLAAAVAAFGER